jgi:hypothetical protein
MCEIRLIRFIYAFTIKIICWLENTLFDKGIKIMTVQIWALEIVQHKVYLRLDCPSAVKMDDFFVVPPYQHDTSMFQDTCALTF